eukprot:CAMPEP_0182441730 /NCGR_PEP_ID=MMETSP1172-20130603/697_1 /TAXON_ID=708627 /ORGANISM="Timspurckia oligopyrenoides, Strain CCMP3278" /LENGTH=281 /DNA_ID=CAMNT_0024636213 /DNA_START=69 /DNA_END=914 /DNA_ORIENTATION=-
MDSFELDLSSEFSVPVMNAEESVVVADLSTLGDIFETSDFDSPLNSSNLNSPAGDSIRLSFLNSNDDEIHTEGLNNSGIFDKENAQKIVQENAAQIAVDEWFTSIHNDNTSPHIEDIHSVSKHEFSATDSVNSIGKKRKTLSAVDKVRKQADEYAHESMEERQLTWNKKHRIDMSGEEQEENEEVMNSIKYKRRLQKNRDSAYVSRIRRRIYTKLLEESLELYEQEQFKLHSHINTLQAQVNTLKQPLQQLQPNSKKITNCASFDMSSTTVTALPSPNASA